MPEIKGELYRIKTQLDGFLFEAVTTNSLSELAEFCAEKAVAGHLITSVTRIYPCTKETPRVPVLSTKEYAQALKSKLNQGKYVKGSDVLDVDNCDFEE